MLSPLGSANISGATLQTRDDRTLYAVHLRTELTRTPLRPSLNDRARELMASEAADPKRPGRRSN